MKNKTGLIIKNKMYGESLKAAINQMHDFSVIYFNDNIPSFQDSSIENLNILLLDLSFQKEALLHFIKLIKMNNKALKIILISPYKEPLFYQDFIISEIADIVFLNSDKKCIEIQLLQAIKTK